MTLRETILEALSCNDVECFNRLLAIRKKAKEMGITDIDERIRRVNLERLKAKPEPVEPVKKETPPEVVTETIPDNSSMARKTTKQYQPPKRRKDSDSMILRMADEKKGA